MAARPPIRGRLAELLADESVATLTAEEHAELDRLLVDTPAARPAPGQDPLMEAAGLAQLAFLRQDPAARRTLPADARRRLERQGAAWLAGRATSPTPVADLDDARRRRDQQRRPTPAALAPRRDRAGPLGWYVAAALALAFVLARLAPGPQVPVPIVERAALLQKATDLVRASWAPSREPGYEQVGGDVVWSPSRQEGYLRLVGLPPNDPAQRQYQLWVVDPQRDARPVDGGVFDVSGTGEVVIPIQAKLRVGQPTAFAITLEQPGGVVVSAGPLLLVATVGG